MQEVIEVADDPLKEYVENIAANDFNDPKVNPAEIQEIQPDEIENNNQDLVQARINENMDLQYGPRNHDYNLRDRHLRNYAHLHNTIATSGELVSKVLTQYSLKKGIEQITANTY